MSLLQGLPGYATGTSGPVAYWVGAKKVGFQGPVLAGKVADQGVAGGPVPVAGGVMCVQSTASVLNQVITTSATGFQNASLIYIPVSTGPMTGMAAPPYVGVGTPIVWNDNLKQLSIYSSGSASWMTLIATTSMSAGGFTTSV